MKLIKGEFEDCITYITPEVKLHNPHRPAFVYTLGEKVYYLNDKEQNIVGPSRIYKDSRIDYRINGKYLR